MNAILNASMLTQGHTNPDDSNISSSEYESDDLGNEDIDEEGFTENLPDYDDPFDWAIVNEEMLDNTQGLPAEELLGEDFEREAANNGIFLFKYPP